MKAIFIDPFSGISGNMYIGAMIDAGYRWEPFVEGLSPLGIFKEDVLVEKREKAGVSATYFNLKGEEEKLRAADRDEKGDEGCERHHDHAHHHGHHHDHDPMHVHHHDRDAAEHHHRGLSDVYDLIEMSGFDEAVKDLAKAIYRPLAEAEAKVHGKDVETVHFHEVGETDSVVDVLGAAYFTVVSEVEAIFVGTINPGGGTVHCAHGEYPVPAPATAYLLSGIDAPIGGMAVDVELTTPTGAAILKGIGARHMARPEGRIRKVCYGAGSRDLAVPNVLRLFFIDTDEETAPVWYSCNIDDMTGEALGFCMERLFEAGARDVTFTPIFMKKNRPAQRIDVLTDAARAEAVKDVLFTHTTTLGIKKIPLEKIELARRVESEKTEFGPVRTKYGTWKSFEKESPEYEDLREIARSRALSLDEARHIWEKRS
ncbi:MAG: nickel pincer cofactor biosynthesis protein LarC [Peptoniphilus sp.]|nr:nickel pincer cofactor biosynthesis protein LarC [Peptoniphilus sp.]MDY6045126.1 nickel pincer cofactor biosynthesis protein LarC [Peptoniphilus sp.]